MVIRASAGTGKTFQLTNRFIGLALEGKPLDTLLAATFTRKAAGEILDRVVLRLAEAGLDGKALNALNAHIDPVKASRDECLDLLVGLLHSMHRLRVGTLDSFFIQIARSFSLELGLSPGWEIMDELEEQRLKREAIQAVLRDEPPDDVKRWMHLLNKGRASVSVSTSLLGLARTMHGIYAEAPKEAWEALTVPRPPAAGKAAAALKAARAKALPAHKKIEESREKAIAAFQDGDWEAFLTNGMMRKIIEGEDTYYRKTLDGSIKAAFAPLIDHARAFWIERLARQNLATRALLERFDEAYRNLIMERGLLRFDDVTRRLERQELEGRMDETLWRLDGRVSHLLLDEFQDTSPMQWNVIEPFAQRVVESGKDRSFFCVGDVKQAIYGWRGGVAEIFEAIQEQLAGLETRSMNKSWRSSKAVIDTVNRTFLSLDRNEALGKHVDAARKWSERFEAHTTAQVDRPGYCCLLAAPKPEEHEKDRDAVLRFAGANIAELYGACPGRTIGVLARTNDAVSRILYELHHEQKIDASGEGGNPLTDSPAVELVLSLLRLGDHPGDRIARYHVATSPLGKALHFIDHSDEVAARRLSREIRDDLSRSGYGSCLHRWMKKLEGALDDRDNKRMQQLAELGYRFESDAGLRTRAFIDRVETERVESPSSARVRVMTIHQAKGLQFDIVVLPELGGFLAGQPPQLLVGRPNPTAGIDRLCRHVAKDLQPVLPAAFRESFDLHKRHTVEESLCVLYVAMTRAKHSLYMIIEDRTKPGNQSFQGLLRSALAGDAEGESILFETGRADWYAEADEAERSSEKRKPLPDGIELAKSAKKKTRGLERKSPSDLEKQKGVNLKESIMSRASGALDRGTLVHGWFELIDWLDNKELDDAELNRKALDMEADASNTEELRAAFRDYLEKPAVRALLTRGTFAKPAEKESDCKVHAQAGMKAPDWKVQNEMAFAQRVGNGIMSGKIDRLVVLREDGAPVAADVIDFKTDAVKAGDSKALDEKKESYRAQLEAYRKAAAALLGLEEARISARLVFLEAGEIKAI
jgi:ATP-dependent exoDNAse (exonuclease V) beta subunit